MARASLGDVLEGSERREVTPRRPSGPRTLRRDRWWVQPTLTIVVLLGFVIYGTWVAFVNTNYFADPYISPFYSPCLATGCLSGGPHVFGDWYAWSPALIVLPFPLAFRLTCYYYRKAYYRSFWQSPPACAVRDLWDGYSGETRFPLILQNLHRYAFWLALPFPIFLTWDAIQALFFPGGFGIGLGTVILFVNVVFLWLYTLSCHSCRHIVGGHLDRFSEHRVRYRMWKISSRLNLRHAVYAWISLFSVAMADVYVRLVSQGVIHDPHVVF